MDFFVAPKRITHRSTIPSEARRVENNEVKTSQEAIVWTGSSVPLQPIEDIPNLERGDIRDPIENGMGPSSVNGRLALINTEDLTCTSLGSRDSKATEEGETIKDIGILGERGVRPRLKRPGQWC